MPNQLFYGDNLDVMREKLDPASVDLCYIDPPFNSKRNYNQIYNRIGDEQDRAQEQAFIDTWLWNPRADEGLDDILHNPHGRYRPQTVELIKGLLAVLRKGGLLAYLVSMAQRIREIYGLLKPTGSFYLHCDPTASHYLKLITDSIFVSDAIGDFKSEIIWRRTGAHNKVKRFAPIHDVIFFYTKSTDYTWTYPKRPYMRGHVDEYFVHDEHGYRTNYYGNVLTGSGLRGGESGQPWRGVNPSAKGRHWAIPRAIVEQFAEQVGDDLSELSQHEKLDRFYEAGYIKFVEGQVWPVYEHYLTPDDGQPLSDIWAYQSYTNGTVFGTDAGIDEDVRWLSPKDQERLGFETQKPTGLLERIISASTHEGDVVLDAFCGCGTTIEVAERLKREWIGIDITYRSIALVLNRLEDAFGRNARDAVELDGIPRDMASAVALAHKDDDRLRKEFEKWAILTYTDNRAIVNEKLGADRGVDGVAFFMATRDETAKMIFQVKSGAVGRGDVAKLMGDMQAEQAELGTLITLEEPTGPMLQQARATGTYHHELTARLLSRVDIVTVRTIIENGVRLQLPIGLDVLKAAQRARTGRQLRLRMR